mgnify:CR=1 FL=1
MERKIQQFPFGGITCLAQYWQSKLKWRQGRTIRKIPTRCNNWLVSNRVGGGDGRCDFLMVTHPFNQNLLDAMWANAQKETSNQCNVTTFLAMILRTHMKCTYCSLHFCQRIVHRYWAYSLFYVYPRKGNDVVHVYRLHKNRDVSKRSNFASIHFGCW